MLNIQIKTIPHSEQRYETPGDFWIENGVMQYRISDLGNQWKEMAILIHELVESFLCLLRGVKWEDIDKFDMEFEKNRKEGNFDEPGDDKNAPYKKEHFFAEILERLFIKECDIDWDKYNDEVKKL